MVNFKAFQAVNPLEFKGSAHPVDAKIWTIEMEISFALVKARDNQKTKFVSHEAYYWWESVYAIEGTTEIS